MALCVSCGSSRLTNYGEYHYYSNEFERLFPDLVEKYCMECNLHQVDHAMLDENDLTNYYKNHYRQTVDIAKVNNGKSSILDARGESLANLCLKYKSVEKVNKIFELGAGYGINLLKFRQLYSSASLHSDDLNTDFLPDKIELSKIEQGPYDIILLSHVLEHFIYPKKLVQKVVDNLAVEGVIVVEVPNEGTGFIYQQKDQIPYQEPHITFFCIESLEAFFLLNFPDLKIIYKGMAGKKISNEEQRRLKVNLELKAKVKRFLKRYPPLFKFVKVIFNLVSGNQQHEKFDLSDHIDSEDRLFLRMILKKSN